VSAGEGTVRQPESPVYVAIEHRDVREIDRDIFVLTFVSDCMSHSCRCHDDHGSVKLDACCQHGADVLLPEKAAILRRAREIASVLPTEKRASETWFDERQPELDPEAPQGIVIRTATADPDDEASGCVFLKHEGTRGCGLHFAAQTHDFDPAEIKPSVCRMYPLSLGAGKLGFSADFDRYSCARSGTLSVYRVMRDTLLGQYGPDLVDRLDALEASLTARRLTVVR
jgi:Fe-S-cluster containining protein